MSAHIACFLLQNQAPGVVRVLLNLTAGFLARGHRMDLIEESPDAYAAFPIPEGARRVPLPEGDPRAPGKRLARYLEEARPSAVLAAGHPANAAAVRARALSALPLRVVVTTHVTLSAFMRHNPIQLARMTREMRQTYPQADGIVAVSRGVADDLAALTGIARERIHTIHNPALPPPAPLSAPPHPWLAAGEPPVLLASGRLAPQKDFLTLLDAFARVRNQRPARLIVLGEGPERERLLGVAARLGVAQHAAFPGFVPDPYPYLRRAALFVLSSIHEGFPNVLLEALACGVPVVSTDCPSGPRELLREGRLGPLVPVRNAEALAAAILSTLESPPPAEALLRRAGDFPLDAACGQYLALLLGPPGG